MRSTAHRDAKATPSLVVFLSSPHTSEDPGGPMFVKRSRGLVALALVCGIAVAATSLGLAQEQERDDATLRRDALYQWYNDTVRPPATGRGRQHGPFSPGYQRF